MIIEALPRSTPHLTRSAISSMFQGSSGTITISAPQAKAVCRAMSPQLRPITVIRLARSWESLVSRTRLMHSQAVLRAGVKADGVIGIGKVVVDGAGHADGGHAQGV